jgi:hypothetical protein
MRDRTQYGEFQSRLFRAQTNARVFGVMDLNFGTDGFVTVVEGRRNIYTVCWDISRYIITDHAD